MKESSGQIVKSDDAREIIFASIRRSLAKSEPFDAAWHEHHSQTDENFDALPAVRADLSRQQLVNNFRENLESVGALCTLVANESEAADHINTVIENSAAKRIAISDSELVKRVVDQGAGGPIG